MQAHVHHNLIAGLNSSVCEVCNHEIAHCGAVSAAEEQRLQQLEIQLFGSSSFGNKPQHDMTLQPAGQPGQSVHKTSHMRASGV